MRKVTCVFSLYLLCVAGCPSSESQSTSTAPEPTPPAPDAAAPTNDSGERGDAGSARAVTWTQPPPLEESRIRAALAAWLAAQNAGSFESYSALYAARFEGVKRSGERVYRFGRAGWLEDRQRMFRRQMHVEATDVAIVAQPTAAIVTFTQSWSSASYQDEGPKRLVFVAEGGELKISREEMIHSTIARSSAGKAPPADRFMFVLHHGKRVYVTLHTDPEDDWSAGRPHLIQRQGPVVAGSPLGPGVPASLRAYQGKALRLYGPGGSACEAHVGQMGVIRRVYPHFSHESYWNGEGYTGEGSPRAPAAQVAAEAWEMTDEGALLVAELSSEQGNCANGLWAQIITEPRPTIFAPTSSTIAHEGALKQFRSLPGYRRVQRDFDGWIGSGVLSGQPNTPWDELPDGLRRVAQWRHRDTGRTFFTFVSSYGVGCGGFEGYFWAALEDVDGTWTTRTNPRTANPLDGVSVRPPLAVFDLDGDGLVEILVEDGLRRAHGNGYQVVSDISPAFLDCGC